MANESSRSQLESDLLQLILEDSASYPWNPAESSDTEAYFNALEQEMLAEGWTLDELAEQGQIVSNQLEQVWATVVVENAVSRQLNADLLQQFATQVPNHFLENIAQRAQQLVSTNLSLADQLVQCVRDLLPGWGEDDLQVLARPYAYAMRGAESEMLEVALRSVRCAAWTELSGIEQARLSLAIARYAIAQLPSTPAQNG